MRRFLICAGVYGQADALERLRWWVEKWRPEGLLFAGGILGRPRHYKVYTTTQWGLSRVDALFLEKFFATLGGLRCFAAIIPGPTDMPLDEFLHLGMNAEVEYPGLHLAHATLIEEKDVAVCGMGGCLTNECLPEADYFSRAKVEYYLRGLWSAVQPRKILLLPESPFNGLSGPEDKRLPGSLIDSYHPTLCVIGGNQRGFHRVASTLVVNPGSLANGQVAWLDWGRPTPNQVELLDLPALERFAALEVGMDG
jgi:hypothetical protein